MDHCGAGIGWVASLIMKTSSRRGLIADIIVGIVGAFMGGYFLSSAFTAGMRPQIRSLLS